eukprot:12460900-Alexandrium_andersonii.AAC.1
MRLRGSARSSIPAARCLALRARGLARLRLSSRLRPAAAIRRAALADHTASGRGPEAAPAL